MKKENLKKIGKFLKELEPIEYRYLELTMHMVSGFQTIIERYKVSKEDFCKHFSINPKRYNDYIKGNFNYTLDDMATLNFVYQKLEAERVQKEEMIKINVTNDSSNEK